MSVSLSIYLSIYLSVCLSVCLSVRPPVLPSVRPSVRPSISIILPVYFPSIRTHTSPFSFYFILSFSLSSLLPIEDLQSFNKREKKELYADAVHAVQSSRIRGRHSHILVQVRYNFLCTLFPVLICILHAAGLFQWGSVSSPASRCSIQRKRRRCILCVTLDGFRSVCSQNIRNQIKPNQIWWPTDIAICCYWTRLFCRSTNSRSVYGGS
jgi:hypothetical protein